MIFHDASNVDWSEDPRSWLSTFQGVRVMGEHYAAVDLDKGQYLDIDSLGMCNNLAGVLASPVPAVLAWLLADGARSRADRRCR